MQPNKTKIKPNEKDCNVRLNRKRPDTPLNMCYGLSVLGCLASWLLFIDNFIDNI